MAKPIKSKTVTPESLDNKTLETKVGLEERALKLVLKSKKDSLQFYDEKFKQFNYFDRLYLKGAAKTNTPYGRANLELPIAFQQIEPFVSQLMESMVGEAPYIVYQGRNFNDDQVAQEITDFTQYQLDTGGFLTAINSNFRNVGKYGSAVLKVVWETEDLDIEDEQEIEEPFINPKTGMLEVKVKKIQKTETISMQDGPVFYNLSIFDFFVPPSASSPNVQKMEWVIHRTYRSVRELLDNPNYTRNRKQLKALLQKGDLGEDKYSSTTSPSLDSSKETSQYQKNSQGSLKYEGKLEVLEWWGAFDWVENGPQIPTLITVVRTGEAGFTVRLDKNPLKFKFKPFLMYNDYPVEGEAYGHGELHSIRGLIEESTALRNARLDIANISLNTMWLVERSSGINIRELYTSPDKIILTNDLNGIRRLDMPEVSSSSVNELARIDYDIQNTTEIVNPRQDVSNVGSAFGGTATGVNFLSSKANLRLTTKVRLFEENLFKPLAQMLNWYNKDLLTAKAYYRTTDEASPYGELDPSAFATPVDFKPTSAPDRLTIAQQRENLSYLLQVIAQVEKVAPGTNNLPEIMKQVYKLAGFPHPERYIKPPQTVVMQTPDGQLIDQKGQPVQVLPPEQPGGTQPPLAA